MAMAQSARRARARQKKRSAGWLPLVLLVAPALGVLAYVGFVLWPRWPEAPAALDAPSLPVTVAGVVFNVPPAAIRLPVQRKPGAHERLDLSFLWPSLDPPDPLHALPAVSAETPLEKIHAPDRVFVTISEGLGTLAPDERRKTIYPRYLVASTAAGPSGLSLQSFRTGTPYQGEDLLFDAAAPEQFPLRCTRNGNGNGGVPGTCLYERRIDTADVVVRFPRDWLEDWRNVAGLISRLIAKLHGPKG